MLATLRVVVPGPAAGLGLVFGILAPLLLAGLGTAIFSGGLSDAPGEPVQSYTPG